MGELARLPNIGTELERQLEQVHIHTIAELKEVGAKQAWLKILEIDESTCIQKLQALTAAEMGINKKLLSVEKKQELRDFYHIHKK